MSKVISLFLAVLLALSFTACTGANSAAPNSADDSTALLEIAATTWPVYCFTTAVTEGVQTVRVSAVINQPMSCLHDYTLSVRDMEALQRADVIVCNGAGFESFMDDALSAVNTPQIDCSQNINLMTMEEDGETETDPHIWMDPDNAAQMIQTIAVELAEIDPDNAVLYLQNSSNACAVLQEHTEAWRAETAALPCRNLITFHDGFQYFSKAFDLNILMSMEEEEGSETSAKDMAALVDMIRRYHLPAIFVEINGSDSTALALARETDCRVDALSMIMSGEGEGLAPYLDAMDNNIHTLQSAMNGETK